MNGLCEEHPKERFYDWAWDDGNDRPRAGLAKAKEICAACPRQSECLEEALARRESFGIWGGLTPKERRVLRRQRKRAAGPRKETHVPA